MATAKPTNQPIPGQTAGSSNSGGGLSSGSVNNACYQQASPSSTSTVIISEGNIAGSTYTATTGTGSESRWFSYSYTPSAATPVPTVSESPDVEPTPTSYINENLYTGTYAISGGTSGCFILISHADGSAIDTTATPLYNAIGEGFVAPPDGYDTVPVANGLVTSLSVSNISQGGGSGSFQLDNSQGGSINITNFATFQEPQFDSVTTNSSAKRFQAIFRRK